MMDKMMLRKKAMESMMKEAPSMKFKKKEAAEDEMLMDEEPMDEMAEEEVEGGMMQFMVSPEEKQMILKMRKQKSAPMKAPMSEEMFGAEE